MLARTRTFYMYQRAVCIYDHINIYIHILMFVDICIFIIIRLLYYLHASVSFVDTIPYMYIYICIVCFTLSLAVRSYIGLLSRLPPFFVQLRDARKKSSDQ